jgi:hypothetical protein
MEERKPLPRQNIKISNNYIEQIHLGAPRIIGFLRDIHRYAKASHRGGSVKELISNLVYSGK